MFYLFVSTQLTPGNPEWLFKYENINLFLEFIFYLINLHTALEDRGWILIMFILIIFYFINKKCLLVRKNGNLFQYFQNNLLFKVL